MILSFSTRQDLSKHPIFRLNAFSIALIHRYLIISVLLYSNFIICVFAFILDILDIFRLERGIHAQTISYRGGVMKTFKRVLFSFIFCILTIMVLLYGAAYVDTLSLDEQRKNITVYDKNGNVMYESNFKKDMKWTSIDDIPEFIQKAFVSVEDKRFYYHAGFDPIRISKALLVDLKHGSIVEGGSTITQQYAKNLFLTNEQTISRKIEELYDSARLEMQYSKSEILEGYLNTVYFGHGVYGINAASHYFFDKEMKDLTTAQVAMLIGIPNGPSIYSPFLHPDNAIAREKLILNILYENELISKAEYDKSVKEPLALSTKEDIQTSGIEQYYIDAVISQLNSMHINLNQEVAVYTYYDPDAQKALSNAIKVNTSADNDLEVAGTITQPFTGNILAIAGGKDYTISQYDRAMYSSRQIASTIKPLLYYCALQQGFTPSTQFLSQETTFQLGEHDEYKPANYNNDYPNKKISMINAIAMSDNIFAVKTHLFLGLDTLDHALKDFGVTQSEPNASEALGCVNMSVTQLSSIYNTFASEGLYIEPSMISKITSKENTLYERKIEPKRLLQRDETLILNQMLTATYDVKNKTYGLPSMYGSNPQVKVGVKSGTSDWDSWVMGFNPEYTIGIWSGFDDNRDLGKEYYMVSKNIFKQTFDTLYEHKDEVWYQPSDNIVIRKVNPITGENSSDGSLYWYLKE